MPMYRHGELMSAILASTAVIAQAKQSSILSDRGTPVCFANLAGRNVESTLDGHAPLV